MTRQRLERIALVTFLMTLAACATTPVDAPNWSAAATATSGFRGAGANVTAVTGAGGTNVSVAFREAAGMSGTVRPWHVHYGSCGNDQGIVGDANLYSPLRPGSDGTATSRATIPVMLTSDRSYFINIHKSPSELSTIVACGALNQGMASFNTSAGTAMTSSYESTPSQTSSSSAAYGDTSHHASHGVSQTINVGLNEYRIDIADSLPAGPVTLHITNYGSLPHSFGIRSASGTGGYGTGSGTYDRSLTSPLQPGQMATLVVNLQLGSYEAYCPVGNHVAEHGMKKTISVQ